MQNDRQEGTNETKRVPKRKERRKEGPWTLNLSAVDVPVKATRRNSHEGTEAR